MAADSLDFVQRGKVSIVKRQYAEAVKICRLGLLGQPTLLEGRLVLGMALTALGRWDEVLAEMRVALEMDPQSALAWLLKGEALVGKGDYAQAEPSLRRAKELDPSNAKADQILREIAKGRGFGFDATAAEPTETKVYPAKVAGDSDALTPAEGASLRGARAAARSLEYEDDATEVDSDHSLPAVPPARLPFEDSRPQLPSLGPDSSEVSGVTSEDTPVETASPRRSSAGSAPTGRREASIELNSSDIVLPEATPFSEDEDEATHQRHRSGILSSAPVPAFDPFAAAPLGREPPRRFAEPAPRGGRDASQEITSTPTWERMPGGKVEAPMPAAHSVSASARLAQRVLGDVESPRRGLALLVSALVTVVALGVTGGLFLRQWRMNQRVALRFELAKERLSSGNYPGFEAAELLYRQILTERDDSVARAKRARVLAQMAFEFGDPPQAAERAVVDLGNANSEDAVVARAFVALSRGQLARAQTLALALRRRFADVSAAYVLGQSELLRDRPEAAADALRVAANQDPRDPMLLHALGVAEAASQHDDRALAAYERALLANANHIATIIDRALLQVRRGGDPSIPRGALQGVVGKLVGDCSSGQLARAYLGLADLDLRHGDLAGGRRELASAEAKRREGDLLLSEQLAAAFSRAYLLDQAEREARRALVPGGRAEPRLVLAEVALKRARPKEALSVLDGSTGQRPDARVLKAIANLQLGHLEAARADAQAALNARPDLTAAKVALARIDVASGHPERAQRALDQLERAAQLPTVAAALGEAFVAERFPDRARYWFAKAVERDPFQVDARLELVKLLHQQGRLDEARKQLGALLAIYPTFFPARLELAALAYDEGDAVAARDEYDALIDKHADVQTLFGAARAHLALGDGVGAEQRVQSAQKMGLQPADAEEAEDLLARAYLREHRPAEAVLLLRKRAPTASRGATLALLMEAYLDLQQISNAKQVMTLGPPKSRTGVELLVARARLAVERGSDAAGQVFAEEVLKLMRSPLASRLLKSEAYTVLGRSLWEQGSFHPALRALKAATAFDPKSGRAFYYLGLVEQELHQDAAARGAFETATKNDPKLSDALYYLGRMLADAGDAHAQDVFKQYLQVDPKGIYADEARRGAVAPVAAPGPAPKPTSSPPRKHRRGR